MGPFDQLFAQALQRGGQIQQPPAIQGDIFLKAQQRKMQQAELDEKKRVSQFQNAMSKNPKEAAKAFPDLYQAYASEQAKLQASQAKTMQTQADTADVVGINTGKAISNTLNVIRETDSMQGKMEALMGLHRAQRDGTISQDIRLPTPPEVMENPMLLEELDAVGQQFNAQYNPQAVDQNKKFEEAMIIAGGDEAKARRIMAIGDLPTGVQESIFQADPNALAELFGTDPETASRVAGLLEQRAKKGPLVVNNVGDKGNQGIIDKKRAQNELLGGLEFVAQSNKLLTQLTPSQTFSFERVSKLTPALVKDFFGRATDEEKAFIEQAGAARTRGSSMVRGYVRSQSGATVTDQESAEFKQIIGDIEKGTFNEVKAALETFNQIVKERNQRLSRQLKAPKDGGGLDYDQVSRTGFQENMGDDLPSQAQPKSTDPIAKQKLTELSDEKERLRQELEGR